MTMGYQHGPDKPSRFVVWGLIWGWSFFAFSGLVLAIGPPEGGWVEVTLFGVVAAFFLTGLALLYPCSYGPSSQTGVRNPRAKPFGLGCSGTIKSMGEAFESVRRLIYSET
jgi:hypothetical protein